MLSFHRFLSIPPPLLYIDIITVSTIIITLLKSPSNVLRGTKQVVLYNFENVLLIIRPLIVVQYVDRVLSRLIKSIFLNKPIIVYTTLYYYVIICNFHIIVVVSYKIYTRERLHKCYSENSVRVRFKIFNIL